MSEPNNSVSTETAMKSIFGFLGALLVEKLFKSFSHLVDTFYDPKYEDTLKWQVFFFLILVAAWTFRHIYGTALSLLKSDEIIDLPLSGSWKKLKILFWRFGEFLSFTIIFHISGIVEKLADEYKKPESLLRTLPDVLTAFWGDLCILCFLWTIWRLFYNYFISEGIEKRRWQSVFFVTILLFISFILNLNIFSVAPCYILIWLFIISGIYTVSEFLPWSQTQIRQS